MKSIEPLFKCGIKKIKMVDRNYRNKKTEQHKTEIKVPANNVFLISRENCSITLYILIKSVMITFPVRLYFFT